MCPPFWIACWDFAFLRYLLFGHRLQSNKIPLAAFEACVRVGVSLCFCVSQSQREKNAFPDKSQRAREINCSIIRSERKGRKAVNKTELKNLERRRQQNDIWRRHTHSCPSRFLSVILFPRLQYPTVQIGLSHLLKNEFWS